MTGQGEGGAVLGERERDAEAMLAVLGEHFEDDGSEKMERCAWDLSALVAQSYERGRADGAAEERERYENIFDSSRRNSSGIAEERMRIADGLRELGDPDPNDPMFGARFRRLLYRWSRGLAS